MKRSILGILLALATADPAWSGTAVWTKSISANSALALDRVFPIQCGGNGVYVVEYGGASNSNAIKRIRYGLTVDQYNGQGSITWGTIQGIGCDGTNLWTGGGSTASPGTFWSYYAPLPGLASWTSISSGSGSYVNRAGTMDVFGSSTFATVVTNVTASPDSFTIAFGNTSNIIGQKAATSDDLSAFEQNACKVSASFYFGSVLRNPGGDIYTMAVDASGGLLWDFSTSTGQFTGSWTAAKVRPCLTDGTNGVAIYYDTTNSQTIIVAQNSSGAKNINAQVVTGKDLRPGFYFNLDGLGAALWVFDNTTGAAYKSTDGSSFASAAAGNITLTGGSNLSGCILTSDITGTGKVPLCIASNGDVWTASAGTQSTSTSGSRSMTGFGPFR